MLLSLGSHDQSKESAWDSHFIEPITRPCSRYSFFSPIKLFPERKHRKVVVHPQAAKAEHRRPGCPLLGATKKTCKILQLSQCPHITCNNCKLGEYVRWGGGGGGWWVASCSGKGVENLMGL